MVPGVLCGVTLSGVSLRAAHLWGITVRAEVEQLTTRGEEDGAAGRGSEGGCLFVDTACLCIECPCLPAPLPLSTP